MATKLKAVVFKTAQLKITKDFFTAQLGFVISESSFTHFVIYSKGIRILFVETTSEPGIEFYINAPSSQQKEPVIKTFEDPNNITIILFNNSLS